MARKPLDQRHQRKLQKSGSGSSYLVTLPIDLVRKLGWRENQNLVVEEWGEALLIKDWRSEDEK